MNKVISWEFEDREAMEQLVRMHEEHGNAWPELVIKQVEVTVDKLYEELHLIVGVKNA